MGPWKIVVCVTNIVSFSSSLLRLVAASPPAREARVGVGKYPKTTSKRSQNVLGMFGNDLFFDPESVILMSKMRYFEALRAIWAISGFWF